MGNLFRRMIILRASIWSWFLQWASVSTQVRGSTESVLRNVWACILCMPGRGEEGRIDCKDWNAWQNIKYPQKRDLQNQKRTRQTRVLVKWAICRPNETAKKWGKVLVSVFSPSLRKSSSAGREERAVRMEFGLSFRKKKNWILWWEKNRDVEGSISTFRWYGFVKPRLLKVLKKIKS